MMKVEVLCRETIKPSSPTPRHLTSFKLSLLDQLAPPTYVPLILFYSAAAADRDVDTIERVNRLKKSLSETLTHFYPVAGRIKDDVMVDCTDEGVYFLEARVSGQLSEVLGRPDMEILNQFIPCEPYCTVSGREVLLAVQVNIFDCGGMAIGVRIAHKIADGSTLTTFVNGWAACARGSSKTTGPCFDSASLFPPRDLTGLTMKMEMTREKIVTRRFLFDASKIAALKAGSHVERPTRVEAVSAVIWRCAMGAARAKVGYSKRVSVAIHTVSLRGRMVPPLPEHSFGNIWRFAIAGSMVDGEREYNGLVGQLRDSIRKIDEDYVRKVQCGGGLLNSLSVEGEKFKKEEVESYRFSSWCRFSFYEADFGWGEPVWVSTTSQPLKNVVVFMGTRWGDGIEAWVSLEEQDMAIFERDQELLAFVSSSISA